MRIGLFIGKIVPYFVKDFIKHWHWQPIFPMILKKILNFQTELNSFVFPADQKK